MSRYAEKTSVPSDKSRAEIERTLARYGAASFMYGHSGDRAIIAFEANNRRIKFELPLPPRSAFLRTPNRGDWRSDDAIDRAWEQGKRQAWRALALVIKAKLEAVETGIVEFEDEFMAHIVRPDGRTMGQLAKPQIAIAYERGEMPPLLGHDRGESL